MSSTKPYQHKVHYYETDQMKIVHHSNYIRWFEEARTDYLDQIGLSYFKLEELGIISPVLEVHCQYLSMVRFNDIVEIRVKMHSFTGVKFEVAYEIVDAKDKTIRAIGSSKHCFLNTEGRPVHLKKENKLVYDIFTAIEA